MRRKGRRRRRKNENQIGELNKIRLTVDVIKKVRKEIKSLQSTRNGLFCQIIRVCVCVCEEMIGKMCVCVCVEIDNWTLLKESNGSVKGPAITINCQHSQMKLNNRKTPSRQESIRLATHAIQTSPAFYSTLKTGYFIGAAIKCRNYSERKISWQQQSSGSAPF